MLGIIVVNYKTIDRTAQYVHEELTKIKTPHKVVIVNNACTDEHNAELSSACDAYLVPESGDIDAHEDIFVLGAKDNLGYAKGNNLGVEFLTKHFDIQYLLFSNNDIVLKDADVVERLIDKLEEKSDIGLIGPSIVNVNGKKANPFVKPSIWKTQIIPNLFLPVLLVIKKKGISHIVDLDIEEGYCYRLGGSFMLTRADTFMESGKFDPATFLYCEEPILSERYLKFRFKTYYLGTVSVIHEHGYTSKQAHRAVQTMKIDFDSQLYYFQKYQGISPLVISLAKLSFYIHVKLWYPLMRAAVIVRDNVKGSWVA